MKNSKIHATFKNGILKVTFDNDAVVSGSDLEEIYIYANEQSKGVPYGALFEATDHYEVTDDGIQFLSNNPYNKNVIAKAYILDHKEVEIKTRFHILFDHPALKPFTFNTHAEGLKFLHDAIEEARLKEIKN